MSALRRWFVGPPPADVGPGDGVVALAIADRSGAQADTVLGFHEAAAGDVPKAGDVVVRLPHYRGKPFVRALAWLVASRLARPDARVEWRMDKQQGPDSIARLLATLGWQLDQSRQGRLRVLSGSVAPTPEPEPASFVAMLGRESVRLEADYGVFSPREIDAGTRLLLDVALGSPPTGALADIGTGYGPLAIGLVRGGVARRAVVTDVDAVALWLATRNATANDVDIDLVWSPDPTAAAPTDLTVCNVPTHLNAEDSAALLRGLTDRVGEGRLLIVVHASLEQRYARHLRAAGMTPVAHRGLAHVVLEAAR